MTGRRRRHRATSGNIDVADLRAKAAQHRDALAALMVTYPSTHGVFEDAIREICAIVHEHGGQVYMDGANMNAQVGLTSPAAIGADVCHLNLHKTFASRTAAAARAWARSASRRTWRRTCPGIPRGAPSAATQAIPAVSAAPWGSASILLISYGYIRMLGAGHDRRDEVRDPQRQLHQGAARAALRRALRAQNGRVAHEMIFDLRRSSARRRRGRRRQAADGLRLPRADRVVPGARAR
jgi:glycine dehydrogenase